jgi:cell wall assembly regulator SMI1
VQKFTRSLTREIELAGGRLALTLSEQGIAVRPVGSRKTPWQMSWSALVCHLTNQGLPEGNAPSAEMVASALESLKKGGPATLAAPAAAPVESAPSVPEPAPEPAPAAEKVTAPPGARRGAASAGVAGALGRLERWLRTHRQRYLQGLLPGASDEELAFLEAALGMPVPEDLRSLLRWHNGQSSDFIGHLENDWDLMNTSQIVAAKQELDAGDLSQTGWRSAWIPFLQDDADDYRCLDTSVPGAPVREFWQGNAEHPIVAPSLAAWLEKFVAAVEHGAYHEDAERGTFLLSQV